MPVKIQRKDFIKLAALGGLSLYLGSCSSPKPKAPAPATAGNNKSEPPPISYPVSDIEFFEKGQEHYDELRRVYNNRINKFPAVIALCKTPEGVALALRRARKSGLAVAIKSGGHCMEGFSVNEGGLVVDVSNLNSIVIQDSDKLTTGPGTKLFQLYDAVIPKKKLVPAGACGTVGIGGLTLGGGYGFFSRQYGLTCDNLLQVKMVDAKGNIHIAKDNDELLWACRGGGNGNFGVVTDLTFKTHPCPAKFQNYRFRAFEVGSERAINILKQWFDIYNILPLTCFSAFVLNGKTVYLLLINFGEQTSEIQEIVNKLGKLSDKKTSSLPIETSRALKSFYGSLKPLTFRNSCAGLYADYQEIDKIILQVVEIVMRTPGMIYQINTLGGNINNKEFETASAYPHRQKPFVSELQTYWEETTQEQKLAAAFQKVQDLFAENGITGQYCNYPYVGFKDWQHAYYGNNYARLQNIKTKYDPDNLIRYEQSIKNPLS